MFLAEHFKSSGSVRTYLSGINTWTVLVQFDVEETYSPTLNMALLGVEKLNTNIPKIRLPLEPVHLYIIYKVLDLSSFQNTVFWTLLLIGFYGMLRKSQFANNSRNTFNPKGQLTRVDFQFTHEGLIANIQWSKTRQKHNKILPIPLKRIADCVLCSVLAYSRMVKFIPALRQEPAFGLPSTKKNICAFSKSDIDKMLKEVLAQCHLDTDQYYFHCLRRGGATCASAVGCSDNEFCTICYWRLFATEAISYIPPTNSITFQKKLANFVNNPLDHSFLLSIDFLHLIYLLGIALP